MIVASFSVSAFLRQEAARAAAHERAEKRGKSVRVSVGGRKVRGSACTNEPLSVLCTRFVKIQLRFINNNKVG